MGGFSFGLHFIMIGEWAGMLPHTAYSDWSRIATIPDKKLSKD
jgi:hypothetical protein